MLKFTITKFLLSLVFHFLGSTLFVIAQSLRWITFIQLWPKMSGNATFRRIICYSAVLDAIRSTSASAHAVTTRKDRWHSAGTVCDFTEASVWQHITCTEGLCFLFFSHRLFCNSQEGSRTQDNSKKEFIFGDLQKHLDANDVGLSANQGWITLLMFLYHNSSTTSKIMWHPWRNLEEQAEIFQNSKAPILGSHLPETLFFMRKISSN